MFAPNFARQPAYPQLTVHRDSFRLRTGGYLEFMDITDSIREIVSASPVAEGWVNVQTRHTTTGLVVNENEPLLLTDLRRTLERIASRERTYEHDDFSRRLGPLPANEPANGHSHCKALFLPTALCVNVHEGALDLGRWQRLLLVELDGARDRSVSVVVMGSAF